MSDSRCSITRSSRDSFYGGLEQLPPEKVLPPEHDAVEENDDEKEIDPKLIQGLKKIEKLDKILSDKTAELKEVKRDRRLCEETLHREVSALIENKGGHVQGAEQLLSLCAPNKHEGEEFEPIFATQVEFDQDDVIEKDDARKPVKDFIKRNVELAGRANDVIAFTEEEERRLKELLSDDQCFTENPYAIPSIEHNHYQYTEGDQLEIMEIDSKLKEMVEDLPEVACGDVNLQKNVESRSVEQRLKDIDDQLTELSKEHDQLIDADLLRRLIDHDSRLTSRSVSICESVRSSSLDDVGDDHTAVDRHTSIDDAKGSTDETCELTKSQETSSFCSSSLS